MESSNVDTNKQVSRSIDLNDIWYHVTKNILKLDNEDITTTYVRLMEV